MSQPLRAFPLLAALCWAASAATPPPPGNYVLTQIFAGIPAPASALPAAGTPSINSFGQVVGFSPLGALLWTPVSANSPVVGSLSPISGVASAINDRGQIVGEVSGRPFLMSPDTPNGYIASVVYLPVASPGAAIGINGFGQVIGPTFLWTPSTPNGTTGTVNPDSRFNGVAAINDFGQVVINPPGSTPLLFTPFQANGATGTFTPIPGVAAGLAINNSGTVLGLSASCLSSPQCQPLLWTPASPNSTTGTVSAIPVPAGFAGLAIIPSLVSPVLSDTGQVAGDWCQVQGSGPCTYVPFLYTGGVVYDLSALTGESVYINGINSRGQMVVFGNGTYLLSPVAPPAGSGAPVTISSSPAGRGFTVTGAGCSPGAYIAPQTLNWNPGAICTVAPTSPQSDTPGTQYLFTGWEDGQAANPRTIVAAQAAAYTANYKTQYLVSVQSSPPEGGTVSGGGWYDANTTVTLNATPASGYAVAYWSATSLPAPTAVGEASFAVSASAAQTTTAYFARTGPPPSSNYVVTRIAPGARATSSKPLNNIGQVALTGYSGLLWTPAAANATSGSTADLGFTIAASVNDRGQVAGAAGYAAPPSYGPNFNFASGPPILWSPNIANGTSGTAVALPANTALAGSRVSGINNYGQVIGAQVYCQSGGDDPRPLCADASSFLWTPSSPNGASGTLSNNTTSFIAIDDFGQAITETQLYTPAAANGSTLGAALIHGLAGSVEDTLTGINDFGVITGVSFLCSPCSPNPVLTDHGFLWTPSAPNGASGSVVEIRIPPGFTGLEPTALNASGQVVGTMWSGTPSNATIRPFLYQNGTVYDLGAVSSDLAGAVPAGINDAGQIVLNGLFGGVYLLTPHVALPAAVGVSPASGSASNQTMAFTFSDPRGWQDLGVVNILINNFLDGRQSCYIAYSRPLNSLYLVNDAGNALLPALPLNGSGSVGNSQCTIGAQGSSVSGNGNSLTLILNLSFNATFTGNHVVYLAARDVAENNSGWQSLGAWNIPVIPPLGPAVGGVSPASGSGLTQTFTFTFTDSKGSPDLGVVNILINNSLDGRQACYLAYSRPANALYLVGDAGDPGRGYSGVPLPGNFSMGNSQCTVSAGVSAVAIIGNTLTLTLAISFPAPFGGTKVIYLAARDGTDAVTSGWQAVGTWSVQ